MKRKFTYIFFTLAKNRPVPGRSHSLITIVPVYFICQVPNFWGEKITTYQISDNFKTRSIRLSFCNNQTSRRDVYTVKFVVCQRE